MEWSLNMEHTKSWCNQEKSITGGFVHRHRVLKVRTDFWGCVKESYKFSAFFRECDNNSTVKLTFTVSGHAFGVRASTEM